MTLEEYLQQQFEFEAEYLFDMQIQNDKEFSRDYMIEQERLEWESYQDTAPQN